MKITLGIPNRPFTAIKNGTKKVEGRVSTSSPDKYKNLKQDDIIHFINENTGEEMDANIKYLHHYKDTKTMLEAEGVENVISSEPKTMEHGIERYNSFLGYKVGIIKNGIYAIGIEPVE